MQLYEITAVLQILGEEGAVLFFYRMLFRSQMDRGCERGRLFVKL